MEKNVAKKMPKHQFYSERFRVAISEKRTYCMNDNVCTSMCHVQCSRDEILAAQDAPLNAR